MAPGQRQHTYMYMGTQISSPARRAGVDLKLLINVHDVLSTDHYPTAIVPGSHLVPYGAGQLQHDVGRLFGGYSMMWEGCLAATGSAGEIARSSCRT